MAPMLETMRWMNRIIGPAARAIVRWIAEREVIACGIRSADGRVRIIYSPQIGRSNHRVIQKIGAGWEPVNTEPDRDFAAGLVSQVIVPGAEINDRFRVLADDSNGKTLSSPGIRVKENTRWLSTVIVEPDPEGGARICWPRVRSSGAMLYFITVHEQGHRAIVGAYTRERCWHYPRLPDASLTIGSSDPPRLKPGSDYRISVVAVDYDGWVGTAFTRNGAVVHSDLVGPGGFRA